MAGMGTDPAGCFQDLRHVIGSNVPAALNWTGPPRASATQTPQMAPWARDFDDRDML